MTVTLSDLQNLVSDATSNDIKTAVADYSSRNPVRAYAEITRNGSNDKAFDLPANFYQLIELVETGLSGYYIAGGLMTFTVKPSEDTLHIWYSAKHMMDSSGNYPLLEADEALIIGLKLKAIVLQRTMGDEASGLQYRQGDVEINADKVADVRVRQIAGYNQQYLEAVRAKIGPIGLRNEYPNYISSVTY